MMFFYYLLILMGIALIVVGAYNLYSAKKMEKSMENYLLLITSSESYFLGTTLFSLAISAIITYQVADFTNDIRNFAIIFFFSSLFFFSLSTYIYYFTLKKLHKDYKEFFKQFDLDLNNKCEKLMLKHIYEKEKDLEKVKKIFKANKHLCKEFKL